MRWNKTSTRKYIQVLKKSHARFCCKICWKKQPSIFCLLDESPYLKICIILIFVIITQWNCDTLTDSVNITAWKVSKYGDFSGPYFPTFGLNTGISPYSVRMQENTNQKKFHIWTLFTQSIDKIRCSQDFFNKFLYWIKFFPMGYC